MKAFKLAAIATTVALVAGCATHAQTGALVGGVVGAAVLGPVGGVAAAHWALGATGLFVGSIIGGNIGKKLDAKDKVHIVTSFEKNSTETWTSTSGSAMKAETKEVTPEKKEVTVTSDTKSETSTIVKKDGKWIKE